MHDGPSQAVSIPSVGDIPKLPTPPILSCRNIDDLPSKSLAREFVDNVASLGAAGIRGKIAKQTKTLALHMLVEGKHVFIHIFNIKTADAPTPTPVEP
jgi:hypothetical protein